MRDADRLVHHPSLRKCLRIQVNLDTAGSKKYLLLIFPERLTADPHVCAGEHASPIVTMDVADVIHKRGEVAVECIDPMPVVEVILDFLIVYFQSDEAR